MFQKEAKLRKGEDMNKISIVYKKVDELVPYENNPRHNDEAVDAVANSIKEFGFKVPCVVSGDGVLITGHTRLKACKKLGIEEVPCIVADDLTEDQIKAFRIADNKVGEIATWDMEKLNIELGELEEFNIDMADFGFDVTDINADEHDVGKQNDVLKETFQIIVDCDNEEDAEEKYQKIKECGIECRLSTL